MGKCTKRGNVTWPQPEGGTRCMWRRLWGQGTEERLGTVLAVEGQEDVGLIGPQQPGQTASSPLAQGEREEGGTVPRTTAVP